MYGRGVGVLDIRQATRIFHSVEAITPHNTRSGAMVITEQNFEQVVREYNDLTFAMMYRKLSDKDTSRMLELEKALESISA